MKIISLVVALLMSSTLHAALITYKCTLDVQALRIYKGTIPETIITSENIPGDDIPEGDFKHSMDLLTQADPKNIPPSNGAPENGSVAKFFDRYEDNNKKTKVDIFENIPTDGTLMFMNDDFTGVQVSDVRNAKIYLNINRSILVNQINRPYNNIIFKDIWDNGKPYEAQFNHSLVSLHASRDDSDLVHFKRVFFHPIQIKSRTNPEENEDFYALALVEVKVEERLKSNLLVV